MLVYCQNIMGVVVSTAVFTESACPQGHHWTTDALLSEGQYTLWLIASCYLDLVWNFLIIIKHAWHFPQQSSLWTGVKMEIMPGNLRRPASKQCLVGTCPLANFMLLAVCLVHPLSVEDCQWRYQVCLIWLCVPEEVRSIERQSCLSRHQLYFWLKYPIWVNHQFISSTLRVQCGNLYH